MRRAACQVCSGAELRALLNDAVVAIGRLDQLLAFPQIVRARLFDVDVFTGLTSPDGHQGVPVIGSCDLNGVDGFIFEKQPDVGVCDRFR